MVLLGCSGSDGETAEDLRASVEDDAAVRADAPLEAATPAPTATAPTATAEPTPEATATPVPAVIDELHDALDQGRARRALSVYDRDPEAIESVGRDSFSGLQEAMDERYPDLLRVADRHVSQGRLAAAAGVLERLHRWYPDRSDVERRVAAVQEYERQLSFTDVWEGEIPHVFFHSLIVYPELAFDGDYQDQGYRDYMITQFEFERMLEELHANDFMVVDIGSVYDVAADGSVSQPELRLPPGKKPIIFSIDDVSYYNYMTGNGFAERLELDEDLNVATLVYGLDGEAELTLTGDMMPILDQYVLDNPDFSFQGAKGVIALTGYEGVFGWDVSRDQVDEPDFDERVERATEVADRLRELGWKFANHSYTHADALKDVSMSYGRWIFDHDNWRKEVGSVVGPTDIYISPFGFNMRQGDARYRFMIEEMGYHLFAPISDGVTIEVHDDNVKHHRLNIDGFIMREGPSRLAPYFDVSRVWDPARGPAPEDA